MPFPPTRPMWGTFDVFCSEFNCTPAERTALGWHLALFRMRKTLEAIGVVPK